MFTEQHGWRSACFANVASQGMLCTHYALCFGSLSGLVFVSELLRECLDLKIFPILHRFSIHLNFCETALTCWIYTEPRGSSSILGRLLLGISDRVNETLGITIELKITSQASNFINQILSFLAYGGSSIVKILNQTSFYMQQMLDLKMKFPVDFL
jgi:hypothetical protein